MTTPLTRTLHRLSAAASIADYLNGFHAGHRIADAVAPEENWPADCEVCGKPAKVGIYCSDYHRIVMEGDPTKPKENV